MTADRDPMLEALDDARRDTIRRVQRARERYASPHLSEAADEQLRRALNAPIEDLVRLAAQLLEARANHLRDGVAVNQLWLEAITKSLGVEPPDPAAVTAALAQAG